MKVLKKIFLGMTLTLVFFLVLTVLIPYINFSLQDSTPKKPLARDVVAIAHRGSSQTLPENTMSAFQRALDENAQMIELDVHLSKDDSIMSLNAAHSFAGAQGHERIPTLDQVLKLVNGRAKVLIELKWPKKGIYEKLVQRVLECIDDNNAGDWVIVQSFETTYLKEIL